MLANAKNGSDNCLNPYVVYFIPDINTCMEKVLFIE